MFVISVWMTEVNFTFEMSTVQHNRRAPRSFVENDRSIDKLCLLRCNCRYEARCRKRFKNTENNCTDSPKKGATRFLAIKPLRCLAVHKTCYRYTNVLICLQYGTRHGWLTLTTDCGGCWKGHLRLTPPNRPTRTHPLNTPTLYTTR